ncbi:hypothetical protein [Rossellomorea sp. BNER]|uniref:hypothetical protein n=1 Tax=Rossellomorea sp. BNER TaxID=2962031 RepID=UPI003AF24ABA|nr:hypothetical protein [Rossellomorea sp. BNER]
MADINSMAARSGKVIKSDNTVVNEADGINADGSRNVSLTGSNLIDTQTEADAVTGVLTFAQDIHYIEILNRDTVNEGTFLVNGFNIIVPANSPFQITNVSKGTVGKTVTVTGSTSYAVNQYV